MQIYKNTLKLLWTAIILSMTFSAAAADVIGNHTFIWNCGACSPSPNCTPNNNLVAQIDTQTWRLTISGTGAMKDFNTVPWDAFKLLITSVMIESGATTIGELAFKNMPNLTNVILREGLLRIGSDAFYNCGRLSAVNFPSTLESIGNGAFQNCSALTSINIPQSVTNIGQHSFALCSKLKKVVLTGSDKTLTLANNPASSAFFGCTIDTLYLGRNVKPLILSNANWHQIIISHDVNIIENQSFKECYIKKLVINAGSSILQLGSTPQTPSPLGLPLVDSLSPFHKCIIDSIFLNRNLTFPHVLFNTSDIKKFTIGSGITEIPNYLFYGCKWLADINIPSSITNISTSAFEGCTSLAAVNVDAANTKYSSLEGLLFNKGKSELLYCPQNKEGRVILPNMLRTIPAKAFYSRTAITSITIPSTVTAIGNDVFALCSWLSAINVESGNTRYSSIDGVLFENDSKIVHFPAGKQQNLYIVTGSVSSFADYAFANNRYLNAIQNMSPTPQPLSNNVFNGLERNMTLYVASDAIKTLYASADVWKNFKEIKVIIQASSITFDFTPPTSMLVGDSLLLRASVLPATASYKNIEWTSSNPAIAMVTASGRLKALAAGVVTITAKTMDGSNLTVPCTIQITAMPTSVFDDAVQMQVVGISPNPAAEQITIWLPNYDYDLRASSITIYSMTGTMMGVYNIEGERTTINIAHLREGIYILRAGNYKSVKFVKIK